ncbi:hypothetical protein ACFY1U_47970 [Streptomyces sp. NPDC001351]|uniref:hypothetical protein n=1 Tax=Streptomyces sp. NPDC001351 TaxID=3364564 RepID=UPI00367B37EE
MSENDGYSLFTARFPYDRSSDLDERQRAVLDRHDIFPLEGSLRLKALRRPVVPEPPRSDENGGPCSVCRMADEDWLWCDERWGVQAWSAPRAFPSVLLFPRSHQDLPDLPPEVAGELGHALRQTARAIEMLEGIARVHVEKRGDAGEHMHWYLLGRAEGLMQCRGSFLPLWDMLLAPMPDEIWQATAKQIRTNMDSVGGIATPRLSRAVSANEAAPC